MSNSGQETCLLWNCIPSWEIYSLTLLVFKRAFKMWLLLQALSQVVLYARGPQLPDRGLFGIGHASGWPEYVLVHAAQLAWVAGCGQSCTCAPALHSHASQAVCMCTTPPLTWPSYPAPPQPGYQTANVGECCYMPNKSSLSNVTASFPGTASLFLCDLLTNNTSGATASLVLNKSQ